MMRHIMLDYFHKLPKCVQANIMSFDRRFYWDHKSHSLCVRSFIADIKSRFASVRKLYKCIDCFASNKYIQKDDKNNVKVIGNIDRHGNNVYGLIIQITLPCLCKSNMARLGKYKSPTFVDMCTIL